MTRLTIRLHAQECALVKREAKALGISVAEFVRRAVRERLPISEGPSWMRYAAMVASGDSNASLSIDEIVYGSKG
jgi:hypothetical protein